MLKPLILLLLLAMTTSQATAARRPVILVPGYRGSSLDWYACDESKKEKAFVRSDGDLTMLVGELKAPGGTFKNLEGGKAIPHKGDPGNLNAIRHLTDDNPYFAGMIYDLECKGYVAGETLFGFPYDWRQSVGWHTPDLTALILEAAEKSHDGKVDIIAHSMGCLVTKFALATSNEAAEKVGKWAVLGGPFQGVWRYWTPWVLVHPFGVSGQFGYEMIPFGVNNGRGPAWEGIESATVAFTLNGERESFEINEKTWPELTARVLEDLKYYYGNEGHWQKIEWRDDLYEAGGEVQKVLWSELPSDRAHIETYIGYGDIPESTVHHVEYTEDLPSLSELAKRNVPRETTHISGDGTVASASASAAGAVGDVTVKAWPDKDHGALVESPEAFQHVCNWLIGELSE